MFFGEKYTAVDIGTYSIKLVRFQQKKGKLELLAAGSRELPPDSIKEGMVAEPAIVASRLNDILKELNYRPDRIISTVPANNLVVRDVELPRMNDRELADAIRWEAGEFLPFPAESAAMDYIVLSRGEIVKLLVMAVREEVVDSFIEPFDQLGLRPAVINIQPLALLSILEYQGKLTEPLAVVDIGASSTRVVIGDKNNIFLARSIATGGNDFTRHIMEEQNLEYQEAEEFKRENGLQVAARKEENQLDFDLALDEVAVTDTELSFAEPPVRGQVGQDYLLTTAHQLAGEISRSLDFYPSKFRGQTIDQVFISGGGSSLKGLKEIISSEINRELKSIEPFENFANLLEKDIDPEDYAVAVGLAASEVLADEGKST